MNTQIKVGDTVVRKKECQHGIFWRSVVSQYKLQAGDAPLRVVQVIADLMWLEYENTVLKSPKTGWPVLFLQKNFKIVPTHIVEEECDDC